MRKLQKKNRGSLSPRLSSLLYGGRLVLSASRIDKFYACRYMYFLQYGLRARPRKPAGFDAPTAGAFIHYILGNVTREIAETCGGFKDVDDETCLDLMQKYVSRYERKSWKVSRISQAGLYTCSKGS